MNTVTITDKVGNIDRTITISSTEPIPNILKYIRDNDVDNKLYSEPIESLDFKYRILNDDEFIREGDEAYNNINSEWEKVNISGGLKPGISDHNIANYKIKFGQDDVKYRRKVVL